ncbi:NADP-dependent isocitrate dehydrogenase [Rhabdochlamydiaceae symbiont of Dictyostelium giganteum]|uniref:NADP-dependent isocitrate dehydrogenase n=1 Tax=Rhabdochlamydiaceae symbiont of Dictyostelium giganteum TaxID=3342349 RepID=UPI003850D584
MKHAITISKGDGIGPEIMDAALHILKEAGADLELHEVEVGEKVYLKGVYSGIEPQTWDTLKQTEAFLKSPITTPQGGGFKSLNVTIRTSLGLYANIRPCVSYSPYIATKHPLMDVVIIRENEEDLYAGIEYRQTPHVYVSHKIITRQGCEKIIRYGFEYAKHHGRKKVSVFTKDNIMKFSDGLFHQVFNEISKEYPDLLSEHWIVDIGSAKLATTPESFDVIILPNLYGDILSDVAAEMTGSVGLAPSANIGAHSAMFEAIHGSAPKRAHQNIANPSGLILASVMMMAYLKEFSLATLIHNAWLKTIEDGIHTYDIFNPAVSQVCMGTKEFARCVVKNLGSQPEKMRSPIYQSETKMMGVPPIHPISTQRTLVGIDVFIYRETLPDQLIHQLESLPSSPFKLELISNRGVKVWPGGHLETACSEQWRYRFLQKTLRALSQQDLISLLEFLTQLGYDIIKTENLYTFDGKNGYSAVEGA